MIANCPRCHTTYEVEEEIALDPELMVECESCGIPLHFKCREKPEGDNGGLAQCSDDGGEEVAKQDATSVMESVDFAFGDDEEGAAFSPSEADALSSSPATLDAPEPTRMGVPIALEPKMGGHSPPMSDSRPSWDRGSPKPGIPSQNSSQGNADDFVPKPTVPVSSPWANQGAGGYNSNGVAPAQPDYPETDDFNQKPINPTIRPGDMSARNSHHTPGVPGIPGPAAPNLDSTRTIDSPLSGFGAGHDDFQQAPPWENQGSPQQAPPWENQMPRQGAAPSHNFQNNASNEDDDDVPPSQEKGGTAVLSSIDDDWSKGPASSDTSGPQTPGKAHARGSASPAQPEVISSRLPLPVVLILVLLFFGFMTGAAYFFISTFHPSLLGEPSSNTQAEQKEHKPNFAHSLVLTLRQIDALFPAAPEGEAPEESLVVLVTNKGITIDGKEVLTLADGKPMAPYNSGLIIKKLVPHLGKGRVAPPQSPTPRRDIVKVSQHNAPSTNPPEEAHKTYLSILILAESSVSFELVGRILHTAHRVGYRRFQLGGLREDSSQSVAVFKIYNLDWWRQHQLGPQRSMVGVIAQSLEGFTIFAPSTAEAGDASTEDGLTIPYVSSFNFARLKNELAALDLASKADQVVVLQPDPTLSYENLLQIVSIIRSAGHTAIPVTIGIGGLLPPSLATSG